MSSTDNCTSITPLCPVEATIYGYYPTLGSNAALLAIFALCALAQFTIGLWKKTWTFALVLTIGCAAEALGYAGRLMLNSNPWSIAGFQIQICCLIMAPAFLAAGIYLTLKYLVLTFGPEHSRLKPRYYTWVFISADFLSLVLQAIGGGIAASSETDSMRDAGSNVMIAGIVWQVATLAGFAGLTLNFFARVYRARESMSLEAKAVKSSLKFKFFISAIIISFLTIFIRCIYRYALSPSPSRPSLKKNIKANPLTHSIPEMVGGWGSELMQNELDFMVLDGAMCAIAAVLLTVFHPGFCFPIMTAAQAKKARILDPTITKKGLGSGEGSKESV
ncbi:MAG: hypothetical protein M1814_003487 [Vezdaea aestivalis]|nr:MAG: hypothetical protein M1814_003487 [Vezdaea aestivalis]